MTTRFIFEAEAKVDAMCMALFRAGELRKADRKALAEAAGISYSTLKTAVKEQRFSPKVEGALATFCKFQCEDSSWVDDALPEVQRRSARPGDYQGRDTVERFRATLHAAWPSTSVTFRTNQRSYGAFDPHMVRHELSDLSQATPAGSELQLFLTAHFEPFYHRSGIIFGFRKAAVILDIACSNGARATRRLGHPDSAMLGDATLLGDGMERALRWQVERQGDASEILQGEYATGDEPLIAVGDYENGTALTSRIEVNLYDRATFAAEGEIDISANKQALIEQIFSTELPEAESRRGWIVMSRQEIVIARYER